MKTNGLFSIAAVVLLAGCVSAPSVDVDKTAASRIKRIDLLAMPEPTEKNIVVMNWGGAAGAFGLIGGLVQASANIGHSKQFAALLGKNKNELSEAMLADLQKSLVRDGYQVEVIRGQWPKPSADKKSDDFSGVRVDGDAILCVSFGVVGYASPQFSLQYEPWVMINAELVDSKSKQQLYRRTFAVGFQLKIKNLVHLDADPRFRFGSADDLLAHSDQAAAGLLDSFGLVADQLGLELQGR
jgi:hypothetical protein